MITQIIWITWTLLSAVQERPLKLCTHSLTHSLFNISMKLCLVRSIVVLNCVIDSLNYDHFEIWQVPWQQCYWSHVQFQSDPIILNRNLAAVKHCKILWYKTSYRILKWSLWADSIQRCLTSKGIPIMKIRRSHDRLILIMGLLIWERPCLDNGSAHWSFVSIVFLLRNGCDHCIRDETRGRCDACLARCSSPGRWDHSCTITPSPHRHAQERHASVVLFCHEETCKEGSGSTNKGKRRRHPEKGQGRLMVDLYSGTNITKSSVHISMKIYTII